MSSPLNLQSSISSSDQLDTRFTGGSTVLGDKVFNNGTSTDWKRPAAIAVVLLLAAIAYKKFFKG